ncbi:glycosyltransferase family 2 protein [Daejeonella oryzae]|uniref:glycosyltransferase family 2 protein n=1 Tax=Daejeonella oryzae TaxID=1122943 RepID=UPI0003FDA83B|nr:glycosyltransferase family 2 protein [Daejeonella oryzae]
MSNPLISIIIPTYNAGSVLRNCLQSIIIQSYKNIEVWVIDGKSTDDTLAIIEEYSQKHPTINFITEKDKGIYDAMNKGIKLAKGDWLYFIGSDDQLNNCDTINDIFDTQLSDFDIIYGNVYNKNVNRVYDGYFSLDKLFIRNICHQAIFFRKSVFKETGPFNLKYKALADWDHNFKWFTSTKIRKIHVDKTVAFFAAGGFSSLNTDSRFLCHKNLKYLNYSKKELLLLDKLRVLKLELRGAILERRGRDFIEIVLNIPSILW